MNNAELNMEFDKLCSQFFKSQAVSPSFPDFYEDIENLKERSFVNA